MVLCLTGCSSITGKSNITNLLSAPKLSKNESDIVLKIEGYLGEDINLKYSQTQGYTAPIQLIDIDADDVQEAVVFYYAPNRGTNIRIAVLEFENEEWNIVSDKEGLGDEVFYFDTMVLPDVAGKQIAVGYRQSNIDENFFVTYFTDKTKNLDDYTAGCRHIAAGDLNGNGYNEIILTSINSAGVVRVNAYTFTEDLTFKSIGNKALKYSDVEIIQLKINPVPSGENALYMDYSDNHSRMHTEVYVHSNSKLASAIPAGVVSKLWQYDKVINSFDIDGDGYLETASVIQQQTEQQLPELKYIEWADWTQQQPERKYYGVYDTRENLFVALPDE